uniref:mannan endo-1,4-beta-mannosidase n=1 Tax=Chrysotila carterae TaxID=13221 RepID=A0A7S4B464_CHRCT
MYTPVARGGAIEADVGEIDATLTRLERARAAIETGIQLVTIAKQKAEQKVAEKLPDHLKPQASRVLMALALVVALTLLGVAASVMLYDGRADAAEVPRDTLASSMQRPTSVLEIDASPPPPSNSPAFKTPMRAARGFVMLTPPSSQGRVFMREGQPYRFVGMNMWAGMHLVHEGGRAKLVRELDRLQSMGVRSLRVLASGEGPDDSPWRLLPTLQPKMHMYSEPLARGLDYLLAELAVRDMTATLVLNNQWSWSGGQAAYLAWATGSENIPFPAPAGSATVDSFLRFSAGFYTDARAVAASHWLISFLTRRMNSVSNVKYADDPTIMAWEMCNEPRAVGGPLEREAYRLWVAQTAALLKALAPKQLVTIGSEGMTPIPQYIGTDFAADHSSLHIDFATVHIRPEVWSWYDPVVGNEEELEQAIRMSQQYLANHAMIARRLGKPLVLQELALSRDGGAFIATAPTTSRDRYFDALLRSVHESAEVAGAQLWAWAGEGRPKEAGVHWVLGDELIGDPPQERQGHYSIFDTDVTTVATIAKWSTRFHEYT